MKPHCRGGTWHLSPVVQFNLQYSMGSSLEWNTSGSPLNADDSAFQTRRHPQTQRELTPAQSGSRTPSGALSWQDTELSWQQGLAAGTASDLRVPLFQPSAPRRHLQVSSFPVPRAKLLILLQSLVGVTTRQPELRSSSAGWLWIKATEKSSPQTCLLNAPRGSSWSNRSRWGFWTCQWRHCHQEVWWWRSSAHTRRPWMKSQCRPWGCCTLSQSWRSAGCMQCLPETG